MLVYDGNDLAYFYITTTMIIKAYLNGDKRVTPFFFFFYEQFGTETNETLLKSRKEERIVWAEPRLNSICRSRDVLSLVLEFWI